MERGPDSKDGITKAGRFSQVTTKKLGSSKEVNGNSKKATKKQFDKKKRNPQGLKVGDNMWLEVKNIHSN